MHTHCPDCGTELTKGWLDTMYCSKECPPYCQSCGKKMHTAPGLDYYCETCPFDLKALFANTPTEPMKYPGVAVAVIIVTDHPSAAGLLSEFHPRDRVLIGKRKGAIGTGLYSLPGGKVDYGETPYQAAVREVKEETDLDLTSMRFTGLVSNDYFPDKGKHFICMYYMARVLNPTDVKVMEQGKVEAWEWHDGEHLPEMWGETKERIESSLFNTKAFKNIDIDGYRWVKS